METITTISLVLCGVSCAFWLGAKIAYKIVAQKRKRAEQESEVANDGNVSDA